MLNILNKYNYPIIQSIPCIQTFHLPKITFPLLNLFPSMYFHGNHHSLLCILMEQFSNVTFYQNKLLKDNYGFSWSCKNTSYTVSLHHKAAVLSTVFRCFHCHTTTWHLFISTSLLSALNSTQSPVIHDHFLISLKFPF